MPRLTPASLDNCSSDSSRPTRSRLRFSLTVRATAATSASLLAVAADETLAARLGGPASRRFLALTPRQLRLDAPRPPAAMRTLYGSVAVLSPSRSYRRCP